MRRPFTSSLLFAFVSSTALTFGCAGGEDGGTTPGVNIPETGGADTKVTPKPDTSTAPDTNVEDTGEAADTNVEDTGSAPDTSSGDTSTPDTAKADTGSADTLVVDTAVADTKVADTTVADTAVVDTAVADTGTDLGLDIGDTGATAPAAGEVVISEVLIDAPAVAGGEVSTSEIGEYVELYNATTRTITLGGCILKTANGAAEDSSKSIDILMLPGTYAVLQRKQTETFVFDYTPAAIFEPAGATTTSVFGNGNDHVSLVCGATVIDGVSWGTDAMYPNLPTVVTDVAFERSTASLGAGKATATTVFCQANATHTITRATPPGTGTFKGSPGAAASNCP